MATNLFLGPLPQVRAAGFAALMYSRTSLTQCFLILLFSVAALPLLSSGLPSPPSVKPTLLALEMLLQMLEMRPPPPAPEGHGSNFQGHWWVTRLTSPNTWISRC